MIVAIYLRVISHTEANNLKLEAQAKACQQFAEEHGWTVSDIYTDVGLSAKQAKRPQFQRMLADAKARRFEAILTHTLDRFSRSMADTLMALRDLESCGVNLISVTESLDFTSPASKRMMVLLETFAELFLGNPNLVASSLQQLFAAPNTSGQGAMTEPTENESESVDNASRDLHPRE